MIAAMVPTRPLRRPAVALVAAACLALPVAAQADCGRDVLRSWNDDGRIQQWFPQACYTRALALTPEDARDYSPVVAAVARARARDGRRRLRLTISLPTATRVGRLPVLRAATSLPVLGL